MAKTTYKLKLKDLIALTDLKTLNMETKDQLKDEVGELLTDLVLKDTSNQRSAVSGQLWKHLSKEYKKIKSKVAPGVANLELTGSMLDSFEYKKYRDGIEIGVFGGVDALKAEHHCEFTARARKTPLPKRQFIPKKDEKFRPGILKELKALAEGIVYEEIEEE